MAACSSHPFGGLVLCGLDLPDTSSVGLVTLVMGSVIL